MMTPDHTYLTDPARPSPAVPAPASPPEAARTWATASRDTEREAWRALYAALYPPPQVTS
jgi:hypothetical protein